MKEPGALHRYRLLMGLRFRLLIRSAGRSTGRAVAMVVVTVLFIAWAVMFGGGAFSLARRFPESLDAFVHLVFFSVLVTQITLGVVSLVVSEFYDVSRILHLPVGYREVFAAMATSGLFAPIVLVYLAPAAGIAVALGGGLAVIATRVAVAAVLLVLGHAMALVLNLVFLTLLTRRKLRDLATIVASLIGVGLYLLLRSVNPAGAAWGQIIQGDPTAGLRWLPSAWLGDLFLAEAPAASLVLRAAGVAAVLAGLCWCGARALRAAFLGQMPSPRAAEVAGERKGGREWLPGGLAPLVRTARTLYLREPQVKALYLQQTVFLLAPVIFVHLDQGRGEDLGTMLLFMLPMLLAFSHMVFFQSLFGLDGRGIATLFLTPVPRWKLLLSRGVAVGGFFLVADLVLTVLALVVSGLFRGDARIYLPLVGKAYLAVVIFDLVMLSFGTVTTVLWPVRIAIQGRRALHGQRSENTGCSAQVIRMILFLPAAAAAGLLAFFALLPVLDFALLDLRLPRRYFLATAPLAVLLALGIYALVVVIMGERLQRREEDLLRALTDTGE